MNSKTPIRNPFQLFSSSAQAQTLKETVKKRFTNKFIYRLREQQPRSHQLSHRCSESCELESSKPSLLHNNFTRESKPKPVILKKKALLLHRLTVDQSDRFRREIQKSREETEAMNRRLRATHIPLRGNDQVSTRKCSNQNTCYSNTIDTQSRKYGLRGNTFFD